MSAIPAETTPMLLWCPECGRRHIDLGEFVAMLHHTHACQVCGHVWRPAIIYTLGVRFLPGFKNAGPDTVENGDLP
jgi:rubredoxin